MLVVFDVTMLSLSLGLTIPISYAFSGGDEALRTLTTRASFIYSFVYLFLGFNMFGSSFFTALNNGVVSMLLSFTRLALIEIGAVLLVPLILGKEGIWWAIPIAEMIGMFMNLIVMAAYRKRYGYGKGKPRGIEAK